MNLRQVQKRFVRFDSFQMGFGLEYPGLQQSICTGFCGSTAVPLLLDKHKHTYTAVQQRLTGNTLPSTFCVSVHLITKILQQSALTL